MSRLPIYVVPHPMLKKTADPVKKFGDETRQLLDNMLETMYHAHGIGLAAPQVGALQRVIVVDVEQPEGGGRGKPLFIVNPEIIKTSAEINVYQEGCLSVPGQYADVERPRDVRIGYLDYDGNPQEVETGGLLATCIQHEIDHLNGILFIDHVSSLKRDMLLRKVKKWSKDIDDETKADYVIP